MCDKYLRKIVLLLAFCAPACAQEGDFGIWKDGPLGKCFGTAEEFLSTVYGGHYAEDENIRLTPLTVSNRNYYWVLDTTPQVNITRTLLERRGEGKVCVILHAPLASSLTPDLTSHKTFPREVATLDTPPPGFDARKIVYKFSSKERLYRPVNCFLIPRNAPAKPVSCKELYE